MTNTKLNVKTLCFIAIFAIIIAVCSWISIPSVVPFTMQTFGIFMAVLILGGKRATISVLVYILLGIIGVPVFAGFSSGLGVLLGTTGGYIIGFIGLTLICWAFEYFTSGSTIMKIIGMAVGLCACYFFGTLWFILVYTKSQGAVSIGTVLGWCVVPYIIPDTIKMVLAILISNRVKKYARL